jgi:hypothetical protein
MFEILVLFFLYGFSCSLGQFGAGSLIFRLGLRGSGGKIESVSKRWDRRC